MMLDIVQFENIDLGTWFRTLLVVVSTTELLYQVLDGTPWNSYACEHYSSQEIADLKARHADLMENLIKREEWTLGHYADKADA